MARLLCQVEGTSEISPPPVALSTPNSCSTCSTPDDAEGREGRGLESVMGGAGLQAFVGAGLAVDDGVVEEEVRNAIRSELVGIIRELSGKQGCTSATNTM